MDDKIFSRISRLIILLLGFWSLFDLASHLAADIFWFREVGYLAEFLLRLKTQVSLWLIAFFTSSAFLLGNLSIASRLKTKETTGERFGKLLLSTNSQRISQRLNSGLRLHWLLPIVLALTILAGAILIYYAQKALSFWHINLTLLTVFLHVPPWLHVLEFINLKQIPIPVVELGLLFALTTGIFINPQFLLRAIALVISLLLGFLISENWLVVLEFFHATSFNRTEPLFNQDISFYVFRLTFWELLELWLIGLFLYGMTSVALIYLRSANSLSEGRFPGFSVGQRIHLSALGSLFMLAIALHYKIARYQLLYATVGVNYGASYTAVNVQLPIYTGLSLLAVAIAIYPILRIIVLSKGVKASFKGISYPRQLIYVVGFYITVAVISGDILPAAVQKLIVQPNELSRERPYIERTIALTRQAFNLNQIETKTFDPQGQLTASDLQQNNLTIRNIRLWDKQPLLETNRQLQQIRSYYKFPDADIDRYTFRTQKEQGKLGESEKQQTIIAARELDYSIVPKQAQTWVNEHLIYTHGYGFTLSPVNIVGSGGLPDYYVKDIGDRRIKQEGSLQIANEAIRASLPIGQPRIYYGENTNTYVMTGTKTQELDYPSGNDNVYNVYDGSGGIEISPLWKRVLFAQYLKDWQMLLTQNFTSQTKLLFRRNILERVRAIAPFLRYDSDPYLVVADAGGSNLKQEKTYLYWVIDAYTTSNHYPYSDPGKNQFNYIRNSVKVVIDAYNGTVNFYAADPQDPIINTLTEIFPKLIKPLSLMPFALQSHIRYPQELFEIQSERLLTYHMTEPQVFYNREDLWEVSNEIYGTKPQQVKPYYLIMKLPNTQSEEFILLLPFKPVQRANLIAWLAARSDGQEYGKLLLYEFPKQQLIYGTEQIEALINQDPAISQQISLWNHQGSKVIQGNLLVIPIERSLLYVEPLYLEAEKNSLPTLIRVVVAYNNQIVMAKTLDQALAAIFEQKKPVTPTIIRPLEDKPTGLQLFPGSGS
ncbi:UPF0182 family protein [Aetokthonos hydrillicola Thurmond2011]|jgi:hypothetical protein|uniref:UPF0182 protein G7B40_007570 n=1 Tax=Aetokthonos hydrillicola Thurmond2011 TaxID=2712845 RepID=A0AAP5I4B7_9CYAN|nr:UPF0182 family protein [Aetokthonos hydrillicola]MBO3460636.1 UPF0182 family protein [Aetokthonos hydrillicola CCALA 1050]MBW4587783.1 UPF0182 family protein [Aetokthonos hydrillicola CCALA 1050]MDR9894430.1 UPF0182 family protein [Aetokthonos hydrillicola Thurmond2011]